MNSTKVLLGCALVAIASMVLLATSIHSKEEERKALTTSPVVREKGVESRNEKWARHFPRQYDSWKKTSESEKIDDLLRSKPPLAILWAGYGFAKDYNAPRGHFYALQDNINTLRTGAPVSPVTGPSPTACWSCKSPDVPRLIEETGEKEYFTGKWARYGSEVVNTIGCADCHDSRTADLVITRPWLKRGLESTGVRLDQIPHQQMRSLVCAQCHSEYYFKKTEEDGARGEKKVVNTVTFPWANGFKGESIEEYYDDMGFSDWTHAISKAPMLKAQHPDYELFTTGIHGRRDVACADCHMPYIQEGAVKFSSHHIGNPLDDIDNTCRNCHHESEEEFRKIVRIKLDRKEELMEMAMNSLARAHLEAGRAWEAGAGEAEMAAILQDIRHGQWRWDYAIAGHGSFFHAPEETLRLLAGANEKAQEARLKLATVLARHGVVGYAAPDFSTKEKAQTMAGVDLAGDIAAKQQFKATLLPQWIREAVEKGRLNMDSRRGMSDRSSYSAE